MTAGFEQETEELPLPRRFGRYVLFDRIGKGGMAEIYLAKGTTHLGASRLAVVKLVLPRFANDPHFATMLVSEAKLAARLSHRNIVQTFDLGREDNKLFIAMEYVEGFDVNQLLKRLANKKVGLPAEYGFFIVRDMLRALDYAHRRTDEGGAPLGLVHRDVSPSNVLVSLEGEVKLCDFGIARAMTDVSELPTDALEGKFAYMSPEHARGERVDGRSDVFAATIILWEMMAGRRMYKARPGREVVDLARDGEIPPLPDRGLPYHDRLTAVVMKGLAPERDQRYATAGAMLRDLEEYVSLAGLDASPMRFGEFLQAHFEAEVVEVRRQREQAAETLAGSAPVEVMPDFGGFEAPERPAAQRARPDAVRTEGDDSIEDLSEFVEAATVNVGASAIRSVQANIDAAPVMPSKPPLVTPPSALASAPQALATQNTPPAKGLPVWAALGAALVVVAGIIAFFVLR